MQNCAYHAYQLINALFVLKDILLDHKDRVYLAVQAVLNVHLNK